MSFYYFRNFQNIKEKKKRKNSHGIKFIRKSIYFIEWYGSSVFCIARTVYM